MTEPTTEDIRRLESRVAVLEMICSLIINSLGSVAVNNGDGVSWSIVANVVFRS